MTLATSPKIPTYTSDGRRVRDYSLASIVRQLALSMVVVRRDRFGRIRVALLRQKLGGHPLRSAGRGGQKYSFLRWISEHCRCYEHKALPEASDDFVRAVFLAVPLSILVSPPAPVVEMPARRPVSIDTERLAA